MLFFSFCLDVDLLLIAIQFGEIYMLRPSINAVRKPLDIFDFPPPVSLPHPTQPFLPAFGASLPLLLHASFMDRPFLWGIPIYLSDDVVCEASFVALLRFRECRTVAAMYRIKLIER